MTDQLSSGPLPLGYYADCEGDLYVVVMRSSGRRSAKKLVPPETSCLGTTRWKWRHKKGAVYQSDLVALTEDEVAAFGRLHGVCAACGRPLTVPESVRRGMGPRCAESFGIRRPA